MNFMDGFAFAFGYIAAVFVFVGVMIGLIALGYGIWLMVKK